MSNALLLNIKRMNFFLKQRLEDPDLDSSKLTLYQQSANQLLLELKTNETIPESAKETSSKILYDLARLISAKETSLLRSVTRIPSVDESIATRVQRKAGSIYKTVVLQGHVECEENDKAAARNIQGLLQQQKSTVSVEMHDELRYHQQLTAELAELTQVLKENTLSMSETIAHQNISLDSIQKHASQNFEQMEKQKKKMTESGEQGMSDMWANMGSLLWVVGMFVVAYLVIYFIPKPANK